MGISQENCKVKIMGAQNFETTAFGKTIEEAYIHACNEASFENGHQEGYSGDIQTTRGFIVINTNGRKVYNVINDILDDEDSKIQKWGPCGAIVLKGKEAKEYRENHHRVGKKGVVVTFFGWAAC
jgi:hypothetical protein